MPLLASEPVDRRIEGTGVLTSEWLRKAAAKAGAPAHCLVQGYAATAFCRITEERIAWPPKTADYAEEWNLSWDFRLFGPEGEWHGWRDGSGVWMARFADRKEWAAGKPIERCFFLQGSHTEGTNDEESGGIRWRRFYEGSGTTLWLPVEEAGGDKPPRLKVWERVTENQATGLAEITDAMLVEFTEEGGR